MPNATIIPFLLLYVNVTRHFFPVFCRKPTFLTAFSSGRNISQRCLPPRQIHIGNYRIFRVLWFAAIAFCCGDSADSVPFLRMSSSGWWRKWTLMFHVKHGGLPCCVYSPTSFTAVCPVRISGVFHPVHCRMIWAPVKSPCNMRNCKVSLGKPVFYRIAGQTSLIETGCRRS